MIAFDVYLNRRKLCRAGVGELGVLSTLVVWRGPQPYEKAGPPVPEHLDLDVGGLTEPGEHVRWTQQRIKRGDVIRIKVVEATSADEPRERCRLDPAEERRRQKRYVRRMAKELGWKITT